MDCKLVHLVEKCPHLYSKADRLYKDKLKCENSWRDIANELNMSVQECMGRWVTIRGRFSKERSKAVSGSRESSREWYLIKHLQFLNTVVRKRKRYSNVYEPRAEEPQKTEGLMRLLLDEKTGLQFSDEMDDKNLVNLLQNYPAIWNRRSPDFKNKTLKANAFNQLAAELNVPVQTCMSRYYCLRGKYSKEKAKYREAIRRGCDELGNFKKWELFDQFSFLNDHVLTRKRFNNTVDDSQNSSENIYKSEIQETEFIEIGDIDNFSFEEETSQDSLSLLQDPSSESINENQTRSEKTQEVQTNEDLTLNKTAEVTNGFIQLVEPNSRFALLGKFIGDTLNSMNPNDAEITAHEITEILFKKKIQSMK